jgi:ornithine cyclodeaminase/alanine dehydrogenase-like protein (mu-crystallin family)
MHEVDVELVHRAGVVVVDSARGCAREAGELIDAGLTDPTDERLVELGCLLADGGEVSLDRVKTNGDVFMYKSVSDGEHTSMLIARN